MRERKRRRSKDEVLKRQLDLTERLLDRVWEALDNPDELYRYVEFRRSGDSEAELMRTLHEERLGRLVKALGEIFELQRLAMGIPMFKEKNDADMAKAKLELEREKLTPKDGSFADDGFLEAIESVMSVEF